MDAPTEADLARDAVADLAACDAATPGPWHVASWNTLPNDYLYGPLPLHEHDPVPPNLMKCYPPVSMRYEDAEFVATTRDALPAWIRRCVAAEAFLKEAWDFVWPNSGCERMSLLHRLKLDQQQLKDAEAEVSRLSDLLRSSIEESVRKAPMRFVEGGIEIEHWAVGVLARSFGETLGTAPNCIELGVHDEGREHDYIVTIQRRNGKSSLQLRTEAETRATEAEAEVARLRPGASAWDAMATMLAGLEKHDRAPDPTVETLLDWIDRAKKAEKELARLQEGEGWIVP